MAYDPVDSNLHFQDREREVLSFWQTERIFERSIEDRCDAPAFVFYDGPPTANGKPHVGHVLTRVIKDIIPRHRTMKGFRVERKAGWDTHGLPVELEVEKTLGLNSKGEIEAFGVEAFIARCKESVWTYKREWEAMSRRIGYWVDMSTPYVTYENDYIESVWQALKRIDAQGLLYHGHKIVPYCPRCGTALSSHEVAQGYQDVEDLSIVVRFAVQGEADTYFAVWTTTPWTLPSNVALAVNPEATYVLVETAVEATGDTARYYVAEARAAALFGDDVRRLATLSGRELANRVYEPLFSYADQVIAQSQKKAFVVVTADYVTTDDGTGIVHIAPAFGEDDAEVGRTYDLPFVQLVRDDGTMDDAVTVAAGVFVKDADALLIEALKDAKALMMTLPYTHSYPFCWRCDTPLIYYARASWFIATTRIRDRLLALNETIDWRPATIQHGRFGHFLENVVDWALSRERYWGTPLPIWICPDCGHRETIGSVAELKEKATHPIGDLELHRPFIDEVTLSCPCGGTMKRVSSVIDGWFDSGSMPFAQHHHPFENEARFREQFPADFIAEAVDQTRGWFYTLLVISALLFDEAPYRHCLVLGHVLDQNGIKMSKHKGNVISPDAIFEREGADALRWHFASASQPWLPSRLSLDDVSEAKRKYMATLWNAYAFYVLYANIDGFAPTSLTDDEDKSMVMDRWIVSRLNSVVDDVDTRLERYDITGAARALQAFVEALSNWYIRRGRARYWQKAMSRDKHDAFQTLYTCLTTVCRLTAPFTPFLAETMYQNLVVGHVPDAPISVHLTRYPEADQAAIDRTLEADMERVLAIVALGRAARNDAKIKIRQPLPALMVVGGDVLSPELTALIADELNVKRVTVTASDEGLMAYTLKPNLQRLGRRLGAKIPALRQALNAVDSASFVKRLASEGEAMIDLDGEVITLTQDDVLISDSSAEGYVCARDHGLVVALDTTLTPPLIEEGFVRETISKIQTMRRDRNFAVTDTIAVGYAGDDDLIAILKTHEAALCRDVLAVAFEPIDDEANEAVTWSINGKRLTLTVARRD